MNRALRAATVGVLLLSPVALSACSAGRTTQTALQVRDKTGGMAQVGDLRLRAVELAAPDGGSYASGDDAELQMAIVNDGTDSDTLTNVSATDFSGAVFADLSTVQAAASSSATPSASAAATPTGAPVSGATPTGSAPATSAVPAPATGSATATDLPVPGQATVFVGPTQESHVTLVGLDKALTTGQYVTLTLTFAKAGAVTVLATVATPSSPPDRGTPFDFSQSASPSAGG